MTSFDDHLTNMMLHIFAGSIVRTAMRRYLSYSHADFDVFGRHVSPMGEKFGMDSVPYFTPIGATVRV